MSRFSLSLLAGLASLFVASGALAHALLDRATPGVGSTVSGSPGEIRLAFTENLVAAFSGASVASEGGAAIPTGKASVDPSSPNVLHVPLGQALKPGVYIVNWRVVSVDTHKSSGHYKFTVAP
jgi:methionine-rich copper-binding protein CopC